MPVGRVYDGLRGLFRIRSMLLVILLIVSLLSNVVMFVGGVVYSFVDDAFAAATGMTTAISTERKKLKTERQRNRELRDKTTKLGKAVDRTTKSIKGRAARSAKLNLASMPVEAIPYIGAAVIVASTTVEIRDLCKIVEDMNELRGEFDLDKKDKDAITVCGMHVPSKPELVRQVRTTARGKWKEVRSLLEEPGKLLPEVKDEDWEGIEDFMSDAWDSTRDLSDTMQRGQHRAWEMFQRWWRGDTATGQQRRR